MGSFQQVLMGATCLVAAFCFGSYLHNRPAANEQVDRTQVTTTDPLASILSFGKKPTDSANTGASVRHVAQPHVARTLGGVASSPPSPFVAAPAVSVIDESERVPQIASANDRSQAPATAVQSPVPVPAAFGKPVVPDFSELASRFRNTPLELANSEPKNSDAVSVVDESERVPYSGIFEAPEMVVRQPEQVKPLPEHAEFATAQPEATRWRVNRAESVDTFRAPGRVPVPDTSQRQSIDEVISSHSADWLVDESEQNTWATNPPQSSWNQVRRREVTQKAAERNQDFLSIDDPGNRFKSGYTQAEAVSPPEPDLVTAYYTPSKQRQDSFQNRLPHGMQPIRNPTANWGRRSNVEKPFGNTYRIQPGDSLPGISMRFYGTADYYLEIYKANRTVLDRITSSPVGVEIEIPDLNN